MMIEVFNSLTMFKTTLPQWAFCSSGHMVHAGGQAAHWDIQNKAISSR